MSRSKWKGPVFNIILEKKNKKKSRIFLTRNSFIVPKLVNKDVLIYNGKTYSELNIEQDMIGHLSGEFSFTRAKYVFKKKKVKRRRRK